MRQLGEQWVEMIDGVPHMMKVVESLSKERCIGCTMARSTSLTLNYDIMTNCALKGCKLNSSFIIKDLGIVNEEGFLPFPWDSTSYPHVLVHFSNEWTNKPCIYYIFSHTTDRETGFPSFSIYMSRRTLDELRFVWNTRM